MPCIKVVLHWGQMQGTYEACMSQTAW
jgi:hypothetical protein